jgi:Fe-S-cluster-containing hydrogenase component 2
MIQIQQEKCTGCGMCVNICPREAISMQEQKARIISEDLCLECGACSLNCPVEAISVTKGTGCLVAVLKEDILKTAPKGTGCGCSGKKGCC